VQAVASQSSELRGTEVSGPVLRMDAGNMQCLTAQVIAHPCHNTLVLQQPHETAAPVSLFTEPCGQLFCIDSWDPAGPVRGGKHTGVAAIQHHSGC
jgi:hypothetical protein